MQRPFVFLATPDLDFERLAIDAILTTRHGVRRVHTLEAACDSLAEGAQHLALAVVDVTHHAFGEELLSVLNGLQVDFPVLVITDREADSAHALARWDGLVCATLTKAAAGAGLASRLQALCAGPTFCTV